MSAESVTTTMNKCLGIDLLLLLDKSISQQLSSLMTLSKLPLRHLFESPGLSTLASLSCLRGYFSNMALGTVKGSIPAVSSPLPPPDNLQEFVGFFFRIDGKFLAAGGGHLSCQMPGGGDESRG